MPASYFRGLKSDRILLTAPSCGHDQPGQGASGPDVLVMSGLVLRQHGDCSALHGLFGRSHVLDSYMFHACCRETGVLGWQHVESMHREWLQVVALRPA